MKCRLSFVALIFLAFAAVSEAGPIRYSGGDGSSWEKAILIKGATELTGVDAEYAYLAKYFPGYVMQKQSLENHKGRAYDVLRFRMKNGEKVIYFDVTEFLGKF